MSDELSLVYVHRRTTQAFLNLQTVELWFNDNENTLPIRYCNYKFSALVLVFF